MADLSLDKALKEVVGRTCQVLYQQRAVIDHAYSPDAAVVSLLSRMENDAVVEVGTIGNEGAAGLGFFLGATVSVPETMAHVPGTAQRMSANAFSSAIVGRVSWTRGAARN